MFKELNKILLEDSSDDSWYDDGCIYAEELLEDFTDKDWEQLMTTVKGKSDKYKIRLAYTIDEDTGMNGFNLLLELLNESDEVVEYVLDSLRSFDEPQYKDLIISNEKVLGRAEKLLETASLPVKKVLEAFLEQNK